MTKTAGKIARRFNVGIPSVSRRWVAALVVASGCLGHVAHADAWDAFKTRCLDPLESFEPADVTGLSRVKLSDEMLFANGGSPEATVFALDAEALMVVDPAPSWDVVHFCSVRSKNVGTAGLNDFGQWRRTQIESGRYVLLKRTSHRNKSYETMGWVEPRLRMYISKATHGGSVTYLIAETNLES